MEDEPSRLPGVEEMAEAACLSQFYFSRVFSGAVGFGPYEYLVRRRLARAAGLLAGGGIEVLEAGLLCGFEVADTFTRAFRRCFGLLPRDARRGWVPPRAIMRTEVREAFVSAMLGGLVEGVAEPMAKEERLKEEIVPAQGSLVLSSRDGDLRPVRSLRGSLEKTEGRASDTVPAWGFPPLEAVLPAGPRAVIIIQSDFEAEALEFAYRVWWPRSGRTWVPSWDLLEHLPDGRVRLSLPLEPPGGP